MNIKLNDIISKTYPYILTLFTGIVLIAALFNAARAYDKLKIANELACLIADINQEYMILESKVEPDNSCSQNIALDILDFQSKINDKLNTCIQNPNNISYISVKTFQRLKGVLYRNGIIAAYVSNTNDYKEAYKLISEENTIINECLNMEIKYLKGQCSKKNLGDWIGRELPKEITKMIRSSKELMCIENIGNDLNNGPRIPAGSVTRTVEGAIGNNKGYTALSDEEIAEVSKYNEDAVLPASFEPDFYYRMQFVGDFSLDNVCYSILRPCRCVAEINSHWTLTTAKFASLSSITRLINRLKSDNLINVKVFRVLLDGRSFLIKEGLNADTLISFIQDDRNSYDGTIPVEQANDVVDLYNDQIIQLNQLIKEKNEEIATLKEQNESLKNLLNKLSLILKDASDICDFNNL